MGLGLGQNQVGLEPGNMAVTSSAVGSEGGKLLTMGMVRHGSCWIPRWRKLLLGPELTIAAIKSTGSGLGNGEIVDVAASGPLNRLLSNPWPCIWYPDCIWYLDSVGGEPGSRATSGSVVRSVAMVPITRDVNRCDYFWVHWWLGVVAHCSIVGLEPSL